MEKRQLIRLLTFAYLNFLPNLLGFWMMTILPEIVEKNLNAKDRSQLSTIAGFFLGYFFYGIIVGAFIWPSVLHFISKRNALFIGIAFQGLFNALAGQQQSLSMIYFYRFLSGMFHNVNSIGKDFVFDFAKPTFRQYAFSLKVVTTYLAAFVGPLFGFYLYLYTGKSFSQSMLYISGFYVIGVVLFIIVFYIDYTPGDIHGPIASADEEQQRLIKDTPEAPKAPPGRQKGMWEVFSFCFSRHDLRNLIIVYFLTNGVYKTNNMLTVFLLETAWEHQGYGVSSQTVSYIALFAFVPAVVIVLVSPLFVPSHFSYRAYIQLFVVVMAVLTLALPLYRDLIPESERHDYLWLAYCIQGFLYLSAPKMYSPFINFYLNNNIDSFGRTALNSITFLLSNLSAAVFLSIIGPLFSFTLFNPIFEGYQVFTKYVCFVLMSAMLLIALYCLKMYDAVKK